MKTTKLSDSVKLLVSFPALSARASTVEIPVTINGHEYFTYMCPGSCHIRSFHGLNQITNKKAHPAEIVAAIVLTGISGNAIVFTDAYGSGSDLAQVRKFVEGNNLGTITMSPGIANQYMGPRKVVTGIFEYDPETLKAWYQTNFGNVDTTGWYTGTDRVHMDSVFFQFGGRAKPLASVSKSALTELESSLKANNASSATKASA